MAQLFYVIIYIIILMYHHAATCCCDREEMPFMILPSRSFLQLLWVQLKGGKKKKKANIKYHLKWREAKDAALSSLLVFCVLAPYTSLVSVSFNSCHEVHISQENRKALNITLFTENNNSLKKKSRTKCKSYFEIMAVM